MSERPKVAVSANSSWNIVNFREGLVRALLANGYQPVVIAPWDARWSPRIAALGVEHEPVELDRSGLNPVADFRLMLKYLGLLRRIRPVAMLSFTIKPNIYGCIAARFRRVAAFPNISGLGIAFAKPGALRFFVSRLYRFALKRAAVVFFQNEEDLELFVSNGIVDCARARRLPGSGIDLERFGQADVPQGRVTFLLAARLLGGKGIREYVEAARLLRAEGLDARWQLLGPLDEGNPTAITSAELESWIAQGAIEYLGETDDVRPFIAEASAVVLPSFYPEGVPRTLLEAAAIGRPLVTSDTPGCRDVVEDGVNGYVCRPADVDALASAMRRLAGLSHGRLQAMGSASRSIAEARFDERIVTQAYVDLLDRLMKD